MRELNFLDEVWSIPNWIAFASYIPKPEIPVISIGTRKRATAGFCVNMSGLEIDITAAVNYSKELTKTE